MQSERKDDELWKVTNPRIVLSTPVMNVLSSEVVCKRNGKSKDFHRLQFASWVTVVAETKDQEILFIRQYRFGTGRLEVEVPGGAIEKDEDPLDAGLRELREETGYSGENGRIIGKVCPNPAIQDNLCYTVLVENVTKTSTPDLDEMEDIEVFTIKRNELAELMQNGSIQHGLILNALTFYAMSIPDFFSKK